MEVIEPDPASQQFLCPNQRVIYECRVLIEAFAISWILPIGDDTELRLGGSRTTTNTSDGQFTAVLNVSEHVGILGEHMINSTIIIKPPLSDFNNSVLTCRAITVGRINPANKSTITLSGELRHSYVYTMPSFSVTV